MSELTTLHRRDDGSYTVRGELVFTTVTPLLKHTTTLFGQGGAGIVMDLAGVTRADSAGLSLLIEWWRLARSHRQTIRYTNLPAQMRAMAEVGGVMQLLPIAAG